MIQVVEKRIEIAGEARIVIAGEIHYFRLGRGEWADRIGKLKAAGCNAVASYIPWLVHERADGMFDLEGRTEANLNLGGFIDLCAEQGLWFFARPGPFIMAEMKNEGLPYRLYAEHPEIVPVGWDGAAAPSRTVDYLAPAFLAESRGWYEAVMGVLAPRLEPRGGNVIAVQVDNEIGMLSWITNTPDLTEGLIGDFGAWLGGRYGAAALAARYPIDWGDPEARVAGVRSPGEGYAPRLHRDLGWYMRDRYARYVATLRGNAEEFGVRDVPFVVNIHGTSEVGGATFPIGISQLYEAYTQGPGYLSGSDHYLGNLTLDNFVDLYLINGFMDAVALPEQPLTSVEFEAGDGNYGRNGGTRYDPSAHDFKLRMSLAQGNRLVNLYLFAGGVNGRLEVPVGDGNDRVSFTGERHGTGVPVGPEGQLNPLYPSLARTLRAVNAVAGMLAVSAEERDGVAIGFIPDYWMTEGVYPGSGRTREIVSNLEANRFGGPGKTAARVALLLGLRYGAVDVQNRALDPGETPALIVASALYMDAGVQGRLADYLTAGGNLLLVGEVPEADLEGEACTVLRDRLGLTQIGRRRSSHAYFPAVTAEGWARPLEEMRVGFAQTFGAGAAGEALLRLYGTDEGCGFDIAVGAGRAVVLTANLEIDYGFWRKVFGRLGVEPALAHGCPEHGIFMTTTRTPEGERFLHLLNLDGFVKVVRPTERGVALFGGRPVRLGAKAGVMLPLGVRVGPALVVWATTEIVGCDAGSITFRVTQPEEVVVIEGEGGVVESGDYSVRVDRGVTTVTSRRFGGWDEEEFVVRFG